MNGRWLQKPPAPGDITINAEGMTVDAKLLGLQVGLMETADEFEAGGTAAAHAAEEAPAYLKRVAASIALVRSALEEAR